MQGQQKNPAHSTRQDLQILYHNDFTYLLLLMGKRPG